MHKLKMTIATGLGTGYAPVASGTFGTLPAIPLMMLTASFPLWAKLVIALLLFIAGVWAANHVEATTGMKDPGIVVIDEIAAHYLAMSFFAPTVGMYVTTFLLFRFFDVWKPFPARQMERIKGGMGIMLDDTFAGIYTIIAYALIAGFING